MQMTGMLLLTFRELWAKKIVVGLFIVSTLVWLVMAFAMNLDVVDGTLAGIRIFGETAQPGNTTQDPETGELVREGLSLERFVVAVESFVAGAAYWAGILLALFATAPLLASLLERGRADLLLSKPISRPRLLFGHLLGVWLTMLFLALYLLGMVWIVISWKTGLWHPRFLLAILLVVGMFAVMYSIVVFCVVWTQSTALALIVTYGTIFISIFLGFKESLAPQISLPWRHVYVGLYHLLPNFSEVTATVSQLTGSTPVASWYPLFSSLLFALVLYSGAILRFTRRDF